jgi:hypothetical protein
MGAARPHFRSVEQPAAFGAGRPGTHRGEIRAGIGLAHPDTEGALGPGDGGQEALPLLLGTEAQDRRAHLAIGDPVRRYRRAGSQQLLGDHASLQRGPAAPSVFGRHGHADPAASGQRAAKLPVPADQPAVTLRNESLVREELANLGPEGSGGRRQFRRARHQCDRQPVSPPVQIAHRHPLNLVA